MLAIDGFSARGTSNLLEVMAKVPESILNPSANQDKISLSNAENWVIRNEVVDTLKSSIEGRLQAHVSRIEIHHWGALTPQDLDWLRGFWGDSELLEILTDVFNTYFQPNTSVKPNHVVVGPGAAACQDAILYNIYDPGDGVLVPCPYWSMINNGVGRPPLLTSLRRWLRGLF